MFKWFTFVWEMRSHRLSQIYGISLSFPSSHFPFLLVSKVICYLPYSLTLIGNASAVFYFQMIEV